MKRLLRRLFGGKHAQGGTIPTGKRTGTPLKLHGAEGYIKIGGKIYYWQEVEETP